MPQKKRKVATPKKAAQLAEAPEVEPSQVAFDEAVNSEGAVGGLRNLFTAVARIEAQLDKLVKYQKRESRRGQSGDPVTADEGTRGHKALADACRAACRAAVGGLVVGTSVPVEKSSEKSMANFADVGQLIDHSFITQCFEKTLLQGGKRFSSPAVENT